MKNKTFLCSLAAGILFLAGFVSGHEWGERKAPDSPDKTAAKRPRFSSSSHNTVKGNRPASAALPSVRNDLLAFAKKMDGNITPEECAKLFEEELKFCNEMEEDFLGPSFKMSLLLKKWAETAPRQALQKMMRSSVSRRWASQVFDCWAAKDPEAAAAFYKESRNTFIKNNPAVLNAIVRNWAMFDLSGATDWIQAQETLTPAQKQPLRETVLLQQAIQHPEQISRIVENMDTRQLKKDAYKLGELWGATNAGSPEWTGKLPEKIRFKAEAGRIMSQTQGNLDTLKSQMASFSGETQEQIMEELIFPILRENSFDTRERISWLTDNVPVNDPLKTKDDPYADLLNGWKKLERGVHDWLLDDREQAMQWIESLPEGEKKARLKNLPSDEYVHRVLRRDPLL